MSWVCANCSSNNLDSNTVCDVCGADRVEYTPPRVSEPEVELSRTPERILAPVEGKVVFSDFAVVVESTKNFFRSTVRFFAKLFTVIFKVLKFLGKWIVIGAKAFATLCVKLWGKIVDLTKKLTDKIKLSRSERRSRSGERAERPRRERAPRAPRVRRERAPRDSEGREERTSETRVSMVSPDFASPWSEHSIRFDIDAIKAKGFVRSEQTVMSSVKGYTFFDAAGNGRFFRVEMLVVLSLAENT